MEERCHHTASEDAVSTLHTHTSTSRLLLSQDSNLTHFLSVIKHKILHIHNVLGLSLLQRLHLETVEVFHHLLALDVPEQHCLGLRNRIPATLQTSPRALQPVGTMESITLVDECAAELEELEENDIVRVAEEGGLVQDAIVQIRGREHVDVGEKVVRRGNRVDADVTHYIVGVQSFFKEFTFIPSIEERMLPSVVHNVQREGNRTLVMFVQEGTRLHQLLFIQIHD